VTNEDQVAAAIDPAVSEFGKLNAMINNGDRHLPRAWSPWEIGVEGCNANILCHPRPIYGLPMKWFRYFNRQ